MSKFDVERRSQDKKELARVIKNFNAKIDRVKKKNPDITYLPEKMKMRDVKASFESRGDFNKFKKSAERFMRPGAEQVRRSKSGLEITRWEYKEIVIQVSTINRKRTVMQNRVNKMNMFSEGQDLGIKRGEMMNVKTQIFAKKKFNFDKIRPGREFDIFKQSVKHQYASSFEKHRQDIYKDSYIKRLRNSFDEAKYQPELDKLIAKIMSKPSIEVYEHGFFALESTIKFTYDPLAKDLIFDEIRLAWSEPGEEVPEFYAEAGGYEPEDNNTYYPVTDKDGMIILTDSDGVVTGKGIYVPPELRNKT